MAGLRFKIDADLQVANQLLEKLKGIKAQLSGLNEVVDKKAFSILKQDLKTVSDEFNTVSSRIKHNTTVLQKHTELSKAAMGSIAIVTKENMSRAAEHINRLSESILNQKEAIRLAQNEVQKLKGISSNTTGSEKAALNKEIAKAVESLNNEKAALTGLRTEQEKARLALRGLKDEHKTYSSSLDSSSRAAEGLRSAILKLGGVYALKRLGQEIIEVRGEMQMLNISFTTLLNSKEKADKLMAQLTNTVLKTPLQLTELAGGAKQLLAFGFAAEEVNGTLVRLGNVSKGLNVPLSDMVYLYGTTMTEGRLFARDLRQFTTRGIPLADELAKQFGVAKERISEMVTAGKIGFPEVKKALEGMTNEGGRFYNLMENQVKSIPGQLSNLKDSLTMQFNAIGESMEGVISGGIAVTKSLVDNLDVLGKTLTTLVATYGVYRTAVMVASVAEGSYGVKTLVLRNYILLTQRAQAFLNATMLANPYVAAAAAITALVGLLWAFSDSTTAAERAQKSLNETLENAKVKKEEMASDAQRLVGIIRNETSSIYEQVKAWNELIKKYEFFSKYSVDDLKNMSEKDRAKLLSEYGQKNDRSFAQSNYEAKLKEIERLEGDIKVIRDEAAERGKPASGIGALIKSLESAKIEANDLKSELDRIAESEKQASILAMPTPDQIKYYNDEIKKLTDSKKGLSGPIGDVAISLINSQIAGYQGKIDTLRKNEKVKNKSYWEKVKKDAQEALDDIDISTFNRLKAGDTKGIDSTTIDIYREESKRLKEAEKMLRTDKQQSTIDNKEAELANRILSAQMALEKSKLEIMQEGKDKELAQIRVATAEKIKEINKQEAELKKAYKAAGKSMTPEEAQGFEVMRGNAKGAGARSENDVNNKYSEALKDREREISEVFLNENDKKIQAIKDRYDAERKWANELFGTGGLSQEQYLSFINLVDSAETEAALADFRNKYKTSADKITEIEKQAALDRAKATTDAQKALIEEWEKNEKSKVVSGDIMKDGSFLTLFGNLDKLGAGKISEALSKAKTKLKQAQESGDLTPADFKTLIDAIEKGEAVVREKNPFKALSDAIKEYKETKDGEGLKEIALGASEAFKIIEGSLSAVVDGLKKMGIAGDEETQKLMDEMVNLAGSASELAMGIATGNPVGIVKGAIGVIVSLFEIFDKRSRDANRQIKEHAEQVKILEAQYKLLERAIKSAFASEYYQKQIEQTKNLEKQIQQLYGMIAAEESKKKRKQDQDKIQGWKDEIGELKNQAADIRRAVMDELMTTDLKSFSSSLAQSMIQGYSEGMTDLSGVVQGSMDDLMRNMIAKQFDIMVAQKLLQPLFKAMASAINLDNGDFEFSESDLNNIRSVGGDVKNSLLSAGEGLRALLGDLGLNKIADRQGASKGIAQASQESVDALGGAATNIMGHTSGINLNTKEILSEAVSIKALTKDMLTSLHDVVKNLQGINHNTFTLHEIKSDMKDVRDEAKASRIGISNIERGIDIINIKGINLR